MSLLLERIFGANCLITHLIDSGPDPVWFLWGFLGWYIVYLLGALLEFTPDMSFGIVLGASVAPPIVN